MDTWATSSLTPQIAGRWRDDPELFAGVFPMDVRPQGHDIIRTWLFSTVVRSHFEFGSVPWRNAALSRVDPRPRPQEDEQVQGQRRDARGRGQGAQHRRRALLGGQGRLGADAAYDTGQMKVGRRLAIKILNATKFALSFGEVDGDLAAAVTNPLDRAVLAQLGDVVAKATAGFEAWDHTRALEVSETFFWTFCDDYLELVKDRAYGGQGDGRGRVRARCAAHRARRAAAPVRADAALRHRGGLVVVARGLGAPGPVADGC